MTKSSYDAFGNFGYTQGMNGQHSFTHLSWYDCRYFSYVSSIVIAKDLAGELLKDPVSEAPWLTYRRAVLEPGSSKDGKQLLRDFLGREYNYGAFNRWIKTSESG
jgi:thimet oligopeptidase